MLNFYANIHIFWGVQIQESGDLIQCASLQKDIVRVSQKRNETGVEIRVFLPNSENLLLIALYLCSAMCSVDPSIFCERIILNFEQTRSSICKYTKVRLAVWVCAEISNKNANKF